MRLRDPKHIQSLKQLPLVEVTWHDACSTGGWEHFARVREKPKDGLLECQTVGYLVKVGKRAVIIAQTRNEEGECAGKWCIPRPWALRMVRK